MFFSYEKPPPGLIKVSVCNIFFILKKLTLNPEHNSRPLKVNNMGVVLFPSVGL